MKMYQKMVSKSRRVKLRSYLLILIKNLTESFDYLQK